MKQSRAMSFAESAINIAVGLGVAMIANAVILPALGFPISLAQNAIIAAFMTAVSLVRSYALRRLFEALHIRVPLSPALLAVAAERHRQIESEGWTPEHDDRELRPGELAKAAACYAVSASYQCDVSVGTRLPAAPTFWPWSRKWWKPAGIRRDLVKAGALILAEIDRFDRLKRNFERAAEGKVIGGYTAPSGGKKPRAPKTGSGVR